MRTAKRKAGKQWLSSVDNKRRRKDERDGPDDDEEYVPGGTHRDEVRKTGRYGSGKPSITISANHYARRVSAPNRGAIPTPGYRLVSELESNGEDSYSGGESEESPRRVKSTAFPYTFYAYGCTISLPEPVINRAQRQKELYADLMNMLGISLRSILEEKWDSMNGYPGLRLNFSETFSLLSTVDIWTMHRSTILGKKAVVLASQERSRISRKRKMLEAESRQLKDDCRRASGKNVSKLRKLSSAWDTALSREDSNTSRRGAKCWSGWMTESARRTAAKSRRRTAPKRTKVLRRKSARISARKQKVQKSRVQTDEEDTQATDFFEQETVCRGVGKAAFYRILDRGCVCNILAIEYDRGWREHGASVELGVGENGAGCSLKVILQDELLFTQEIRQSAMKHTTNPFTGAYMWKADKSWILEFKHSYHFNAFRRLHEECFENNYNASVRKINSRPRKPLPIPSFREVKPVDPRWRGPAFIRPANGYIKAAGIDFESRASYDMDIEDEEWLKKFNARPGMYKQKIPEQKFEKVIYTLEKYSHARNEILSEDAATEVCLHVASLKIIKSVYKYWIVKRQKSGMSLVRQFQPERWKQYRLKRNRTSKKDDVFAFCMPPRGMEVPDDLPTSSADAISGLTTKESSPEGTPQQRNDSSTEEAPPQTACTACPATGPDYASPENQFEVVTPDGVPPRPGQLVLKKFVGRASAQEQKRMKLWKQLQQSGIKHFHRRAHVPIMKTSSSSAEDGTEALLSLREGGSNMRGGEGATELHALADAAILNGVPQSPQVARQPEDSEATATASHQEDTRDLDEVTSHESKKSDAIEAENGSQVTGPETPRAGDREPQPGGSSPAQDQVAGTETADVHNQELEQVEKMLQRQQPRRSKAKVALGIVLRPRKEKPKQKQATKQRRQKRSGKKTSKWSLEIRRAVETLNKQPLQVQVLQRSLQPAKEGALSIKRIPRMATTARFSTLLMVVANSSK